MKLTKPIPWLVTLSLLVVLGIAASIVIPRFQSSTQEAASSASGPSDKTQYWISGMHPWIVMPEPGQCPICGMDLVPLDPEKFSGEITINPVVVQNMGVRIDEVTEGPLIKTIRTVGIVEYDEKRVRDINPKVSGWIEEIYVDSLGARVEHGQKLFSLYSPQLYSAQEDYLIASRSGNDSLIEAAKKRLEYFDVTDEQIARLKKRGEPEKAVILRSPFDGVVTEKHANEGMKVDPGMQTYRLADLSQVWVIATVYEYQLPYLEEGQQAVMTLPYIPGQTFEGRVSYIYPYLDEKIREAKVRIEFDNSNGILKPGMFANVELKSRLSAEATLAPRSAIVDTGVQKTAFVSMGEGRFEPREVETGLVTDEARIQILSGLKPGEQVVTSGQFLLDSEANMREALAKMMEGTPASEQAPVIPGLEPAATELTSDAAEPLREALTHYFTIQNALASDSLDNLAEAAGKLAQAIDSLPVEGANLDQMIKEATELAGADDIETARLGFGKLSVPFRNLILSTGVPPGIEDDVLALRCPMFLRDQGGAVWLQVAGDIRNPYMGERMLECFDERLAVPAAAEQ